MAIDVPKLEKDGQRMTTAEMQRLARSYAPQAFKALEDIAENADSEQVRSEARKTLAERAHLRQALTQTNLKK